MPSHRKREEDKENRIPCKATPIAKKTTSTSTASHPFDRLRKFHMIQRHISDFDCQPGDFVLYEMEQEDYFSLCHANKIFLKERNDKLSVSKYRVKLYLRRPALNKNDSLLSLISSPSSEVLQSDLSNAFNNLKANSENCEDDGDVVKLSSAHISEDCDLIRQPISALDSGTTSNEST